MISNVLALLVITTRLSLNHRNSDRKFTLLGTRHITNTVQPSIYIVLESHKKLCKLEKV
jgi:hypothetical protein